MREALSIQVTRDRLSDTHAYRSLVQLTRFAIDLYAIREAQRAWSRRFEGLEPKGTVEEDEHGSGGDDHGGDYALDVGERANLVRDLLEENADVIPEQVLDTMRQQIEQVADTARRQRNASETRIGLLGALATAGITALANEHEAAKQNALLRRLVRRLRSRNLTLQEVPALADDIERVLERAAASRRLFSHLLDARTRDSTGTFLASRLVEDVSEQLRPLTRGVPVDARGVPQNLRLAQGGYAEWTALLQNVLINAVNATLDSDVRRIDLDGGEEGGRAWLRVQDTGSGVDLRTAERLFLPFERRQPISPERAALGLGGTGLGLTIVRMLATNLGATVAFEEPDDDHRTAIVIRWRSV